MPNELFQFMVDFTMPRVLTERFTSLIPNQRAMVNEYFKDGKLVSYAVSLENSKVWAVFMAEDEERLEKMVEALPLTQYMKYSIAPLTFYNLMTERVPEFSVN